MRRTIKIQVRRTVTVRTTLRTRTRLTTTVPILGGGHVNADEPLESAAHRHLRTNILSAEAGALLRISGETWLALDDEEQEDLAQLARGRDVKLLRVEFAGGART